MFLLLIIIPCLSQAGASTDRAAQRLASLQHRLDSFDKHKNDAYNALTMQEDEERELIQIQRNRLPSICALHAKFHPSWQPDIHRAAITQYLAITQEKEATNPDNYAFMNDLMGKLWTVVSTVTDPNIKKNVVHVVQQYHSQIHMPFINARNGALRTNPRYPYEDQKHNLYRPRKLSPNILKRLTEQKQKFYDDKKAQYETLLQKFTEEIETLRKAQEESRTSSSFAMPSTLTSPAMQITPPNDDQNGAIATPQAASLTASPHGLRGNNTYSRPLSRAQDN